MNVHRRIKHNDLIPHSFLEAITRVFPDALIHTNMMEIKTAIALLENDADLARWLTGEELQKLHSFALPKRKNEWLAGRICAKVVTACQLQLSQPVHYHKIKIANNESGRPYLQLTSEYAHLRMHDISISHSGDFAIAICADNFCGVDIQKSSDTLTRVQERYCNSNEFSQLAHILGKLPENKRLNLLWTAKEAIRKAIGHKYIPGFQEILLQEISTDLSTDVFTLICSLRSEKIRVVSTLERDYALSISISGIK